MKQPERPDPTARPAARRDAPIGPPRPARSPTEIELDKAGPEDALFERLPEPDHFQPTALTGGPWDPRHQHGGAVAGLLTHCLDHVESPVPMRLTRITLEMFRGVPLTPLRVETRVLRAGRRVQGLEANLFDGQTQVARATALRLRRDDGLARLASTLPIPAEVAERPKQVLSLATARRFEDGKLPIPGFVRSVELGSFQTSVRDGVPTTVWARLLCRVVAGVAPSPTVRLATLVDFASGTGSALDYARYTSINPDLTIHVLREPRTEWIAIHGATCFADDGVGQSTATIYDEQGRIAGVQACLLLDRRGPDEPAGTGGGRVENE
ncbi:MAG: thioesterase family protein [Myxococcota bacterium]